MNTQRLAGGQVGFFTANAHTGPTARVATSLSSYHIADGFRQQKASLAGKASVSAAVLAAALKASRAVTQLTKAEELMESAFRRMSNLNRNQVDVLRAREEMAQALQIRKSVMPDLSEGQQKALSAISAVQQDGINEASWGVFDSRYGGSFEIKGLAEIERGRQLFQQGVQENQSLAKWILS